MKINENKKKTKYDACLCFSIIEFCVHVRDKKKIEKSETERERELNCTFFVFWLFLKWFFKLERYQRILQLLQTFTFSSINCVYVLVSVLFYNKKIMFGCMDEWCMRMLYAVWYVYFGSLFAVIMWISLFSSIFFSCQTILFWFDFQFQHAMCTIKCIYSYKNIRTIYKLNKVQINDFKSKLIDIPRT